MTKRQYYIYDLECYPNCFLFCGKFTGDDETRVYELSERVDQRSELLTWLSYIQQQGVEMVGFNNVGFDYPIVHELMTNPYTFDYVKAKKITDQIINAQKYNKRIKSVGYYNRLIPQIDLYLLNHFNNKARSTSLKALEFAMRSESVEDLPFDPNESLTSEQIDKLREYNVHDVKETEKFLNRVEHAIDMRRDYVEKGILKGDVLNWSDVKIGSEMMITRLGKNVCFANGRPRQTIRPRVDFKDVILPKIKFKTEKYNELLEEFKTKYITPGGGKQPHIERELAGLPFHFGVGGVHASADNKVFHTDDKYQIIDVDVAGMYPSIAIANGFAPEHLGERFVTVYKQIKEDRAKHAKGTPQNAALKLAGNGTYGKSSDVYSPMYDPKFTFSVTINGQLQLAQLVEMVELLPDCELIQGNTDGITLLILKDNLYLFRMWCQVWEEMTGLELEEALYSRMWIRDVNNYIAETMDGKLKRKGTYWYPTNDKEYDGWWNKNFSNLASKKAAEKVMTHSWPLETALKVCTDPFDFMLRYKATGGAKLYVGDTPQLKFVRYYVSTAGEPMYKIAKPKGEIGQYKRKNKLTDDYFNSVMQEIGRDVWDARIHTGNKKKYDMTKTSVESGWKVKICNKASDFDWNDVDWNYYLNEAKKIIIGSK